MIRLETQRLLLRPARAKDLQFIYDMHQHPDLIRFIPSARTSSLEEAKVHLDRFKTLTDHPYCGYPVIELKDSGAAAGLLMIKPIPPSGGGEPREIEIGWRQIERYCGHGYVTEAASAMLTAFPDAGLRRVVAVTDPDNIASQGVARRIGMTELGLTEAYYDTQTMAFVWEG